MNALTSLGLNSQVSYGASDRSTQSWGVTPRAALWGVTAGLVTLSMLQPNNATAQQSVNPQAPAGQVDSSEMQRLPPKTVTIPAEYSLVSGQITGEQGKRIPLMLILAGMSPPLGHIEGVEPPLGQDPNQEWDSNVLIAEAGNQVASIVDAPTYVLISSDGKKSTAGRSLVFQAEGQPPIRVFRSTKGEYALLSGDSPGQQRILAEGKVQSAKDKSGQVIQKIDFKQGKQIVASVSWTGDANTVQVSQVGGSRLVFGTNQPPSEARDLATAVFAAAGTVAAWEPERTQEKNGHPVAAAVGIAAVVAANFLGGVWSVNAYGHHVFCYPGGYYGPPVIRPPGIPLVPVYGHVY
jgi:hypothetical protein